ncbi:trypsin-like serine peptidase [Palleronia abyssalis]|nr:hypothetical protein [Palleronia abyssalis]
MRRALCLIALVLLPGATDPPPSEGVLRLGRPDQRDTCTAFLIAPATALTTVPCARANRNLQGPATTYRPGAILRPNLPPIPEYHAQISQAALPLDPATLLTPLPTGPAPPVGAILALITYPAGATDPAHRTCRLIDRRGMDLLLDCPTAPAERGSPVLTRTADGWHAAAILIAGIGTTRSLATLISPQLLPGYTPP